MRALTIFLKEGSQTNFTSFMFIYICGFTAFKNLCILLSFANWIFGHGTYNLMPMQAKRRDLDLRELLKCCFSIMIILWKLTSFKTAENSTGNISDLEFQILRYLLFAMVILVCLLVCVLPSPVPPISFFFSEWNA